MLWFLKYQRMNFFGKNKLYEVLLLSNCYQRTFENLIVSVLLLQGLNNKDFCHEIKFFILSYFYKQTYKYNIHSYEHF